MSMTNSSAGHKRPVAITVICVIGVIGALFTVPLIFSDAASSIGSWYPPFLAAASAIGLACMVGLWMMRKWAVYAYTALAVAGQAILLATGLFSPIGLILPAIVVVVMFMYISRMR